MKKIKFLYGIIIILIYIIFNISIVFGGKGNGFVTTDGKNIYKISENNPRAGNDIYKYDMKGKKGECIYYSNGYIEIKGIYNDYLFFNEYSDDTGLKVMSIYDNSVKKICETIGNVEYYGGNQIYLRTRNIYFNELLCANINGDNVKQISDCIKEYMVKDNKLYYIEHIDNRTNCFRIYKADTDGSNVEILYDNFVAVDMYFTNKGLRWDLLEQGEYNGDLSRKQKWTYYLRNLDTGKDKIVGINDKKNIDLGSRICCSDKEKEYYCSYYNIYKLNSQNEAVKIGKLRSDDAFILGVEDKYLLYADNNNVKKIKLNVNKNDNKNIFVKIFDKLSL